MLAYPNLILFAQHGMKDDNQALAYLAHNLASEKTLVVAPSLGYFETLLIQVNPLIKSVAQIATATFTQHPDIPVRIVAHSLGGIIWLEVLHRYPEWWSRVHSLILIGSPVGGAHLAKIADPFGWGIGIARDLGMDRRAIAERIAKVIPTFVIAGDIDNGSDGTVAIASTKFKYAHFICLDGVNHCALSNHPAVASAIREFWSESRQPALDEACFTDGLIRSLRNVPGITDAHPRDFSKAQLWLTFKDGTKILRWKNPVGVDHVFIANAQGQCIYGGYVGWMHSENLAQILGDIKHQLGGCKNEPSSSQ